jgi:tetratricopeptide (TPR) repeat protein
MCFNSFRALRVLRGQNILLFFLLGLVFASHIGIQHEVGKTSLARRLGSLPDKRVMQLAFLDGRELAADYLWLTTDRRGLNTLKGAELIDGKSRAFYLFDAITELDPYFYVVYLYAATFLSGPQYLRDVAGGQIILERAMYSFPDRWEFPFFLGSAYYDTLGDKQTAARYFEQALKTGNPPTFLVDFIAMIYRQEQRTEMPVSYYRRLRNECKNETLKSYLDALIQTRMKQD